MKHRHSWEGVAPESDAGCGVQRGYPRINAFFFFSRIHVDLARFVPTQLLFKPYQANAARIKPYRPNRVVSADDWNGLKRLKQAEINLESCRNSRNRLWMRPKHPKSILSQFYSKYLLLLLCFLFCLVFCFVFLAFFFLCFLNQGIVMCFLRIFE